MDFKTLRYIKPALMALLQYADNYYEKPYKVADTSDESTIKNIFINDVDLFICRSLCKYQATHTQADLTDILIKALSLIAIQNGATKLAIIKQSSHIMQTVQRAYLEQALCSCHQD